MFIMGFVFYSLATRIMMERKCSSVLDGVSKYDYDDNQDPDFFYPSSNKNNRGMKNQQNSPVVALHDNHDDDKNNNNKKEF